MSFKKIFTFVLFFKLPFTLYSESSKIILSLDGGGVRGIIEAFILEALEKQLNTPLIQLVDVIVGTSTGGLIALALSTPNAFHQPLYRPQQIVQLYRSEMKNIFDQSLFSKFKRTFGLWRTKYSVDYFDSWLLQQFKRSTLSNTLIPVGVTTYNTTLGQAVLLNSTYSSALYQKMTIRGAARATTAAPLYFDPYDWNNHQLLDGGIYANNPSLLGLIYAQKLFPTTASYTIISLGTGYYRQPRYQGGGVLQGAVPIAHQLLEMPGQLIPLYINQCPNAIQYHRLQPQLSHRVSLDDTDCNDILQQAAEKAIKTAAFEKIVHALQQKKTH